MKLQALFRRTSGHRYRVFESSGNHGGRLPKFQAQSSSRPLNNSLSGRPQMAQVKQCDHLHRVLGRTCVAHVAESKLTLNQTKRMLDLGAYAGLDLFGFVQEVAPRRLFVQRAAVARIYDQKPVHIGGFRPLGWSLVARVCKHRELLTKQRIVPLGRVADASLRPEDGVHQTGMCIHTTVRCHVKVLLPPNLDLVGVRVAYATADFYGARFGNLGSTDHPTGLEQKPADGQIGVDAPHDMRNQNVHAHKLVRTSGFTEVQDSRLIGDADHSRIQAAKLTEKAGAVQALFHRRVDMTQEMLRQLHGIHHLNRNGCTSLFSPKVMRRVQPQQLTPKVESIHLGQQPTLWRDFGNRFKSVGGEAFLLHLYFGATGITSAHCP